MGHLYQRPYNDLRRTISDVKRTYYNLKSEMSSADKQISELYHELEKTDLSFDLGYQYSVALQNLLRKRRIIKDEFIPVEIMFRSLTKSFPDLKEQIRRNREKSEEVRASLNVTYEITEILNIKAEGIGQ